MSKVYKFEKSCGPVASISGVLIFIVGVFYASFSILGLVFLILGAFLAFTYSSTEIDIKENRFRSSENIFGFIKIGKWHNIDKKMKIGILFSNKNYKTYSKGNRVLNTYISTKKIYLYREDKLIAPLKNISKNQNVKKELYDMSEFLGLEISSKTINFINIEEKKQEKV